MSRAIEKLLYQAWCGRSVPQSRWIAYAVHHPPTLLPNHRAIHYDTRSSLCFKRNRLVQNEFDGISRRWGSRSSTPSKTSLRRVAAEAERSRSSLGSAGTIPEVPNTEIDVRIVTAICGVDLYDMERATTIVQAHGYLVDPYKTGLYPQVLHVQQPVERSTDQKKNEVNSDLFIFPSGIVVAWGLSEERLHDFVARTLMPAAQNEILNTFETEHLEYEEDPNSDKSKMVGDVIKLGVKINISNVAEEVSVTRKAESIAEAQTLEKQLNHQHEANLVLAKIAFSSGLAKSVKLAVLEDTLEAYFQSTRTIPDMMASASRLPFTRRFILRKTGELLKARQQLNLTSELTDGLPDMFWDSRHELRLESYFEQVGRALDVNARSRVLNQKMDYAQEIVSVLREQLSERHSLKLEWLIIILIAIEVAFEIRKLVKEYFEDQSDDDKE